MPGKAAKSYLGMCR